jgi:single-strand DNA-binding protein
VSTSVCNLAYSFPVEQSVQIALMSERNPMFQHPEWDVPAIAKALIGAEHVPEVSPSETAGTTLPIGEASLTLFPEEQAIEFKKESLEHTVFLRLSASGEIAFSFTPKPPVAATGENALLPEPVAAGVPEEPPEQTPIPAEKPPEKENKERVVITGRVGREPTIKQIKTRLMAKFPVAQHNPDGSTTWNTIVAFGSKAEALQETITKGQQITVAGYPHTRETQTKSGQKRTVTEIYLADLKHHK